MIPLWVLVLAVFVTTMTVSAVWDHRLSQLAARHAEREEYSLLVRKKLTKLLKDFVADPYLTDASSWSMTINELNPAVFKARLRAWEVERNARITGHCYRIEHYLDEHELESR